MHTSIIKNAVKLIIIRMNSLDLIEAKYNEGNVFGNKSKVGFKNNDLFCIKTLYNDYPINQISKIKESLIFLSFYHIFSSKNFTYFYINKIITRKKVYSNHYEFYLVNVL